MRTVIIPLLLLISFNAAAQKTDYWRDSFETRPNFKIGDHRNYSVSGLSKTEMFPFSDRIHEKYFVQFLVTDTAQGGYWIQYRVRTLAPQDKELSASTIISVLSNGISLMFWLKGDGVWSVDSVNYARTRRRIARSVDSMITTQELLPSNRYAVARLQKDLQTDDGLEVFLSPMLSFINMYDIPSFKKYKSERPARTYNSLNESLITGVLSREWTSASAKDKTVKLEAVFTGDAPSATKYFKAMFTEILQFSGKKIRKNTLAGDARFIIDFSYTAEMNSKFPVYIFKKTVLEYVTRAVTKIELKVTDEFFLGEDLKQKFTDLVPDAENKTGKDIAQLKFVKTN